MTPEERNADLAIDIAKNHFATHRECAWEAVDELSQIVITAAALAWLKDATPALIAHGWTPPTTQGPTP